MNGPDYVPSWPNGIGNGRLRGMWDNDGFAAEEEQPTVDTKLAFTSLGFIGSALKRKWRTWCAVALVGLVVGVGLYVKFPAAYQASTTILLRENPDENPSVAIQTDTTLAESSQLAERVIQQLGLRESVSSLLSSYTALAVTNNAITITVNASSSDVAVRLASALATDFLDLRANYYQTQQQQTASELDQQFNQAQQRLNSIDAQIAQVSAQPYSRAQQTTLNNLEAQRAIEIGIEQYANSTKVSNNTITYQMVKFSQIMDGATALPHSRKKRMLEEIVGGLLGGLAVGLGIVIVQALVSERLRRRDDIADALGAPVRLSVRSPRRRRRLGRPGLTDRDMGRVVAHLKNIVARGFPGSASLAIVAVDNARIVAPAVISLAVSCARDGRQVLLADLSGGILTTILGAGPPGVHTVQMEGGRLIVAAPEQEDIQPAGPFQREAQGARVSQELLAAWTSADLLIVLATLDPALDAGYVSTWATGAVAVVTAGQSSGTRIHGVGEMLRLAGTRLDSAVVIGADKSDESIGAVNTPDQALQL